jgi:acyl carrier protein
LISTVAHATQEFFYGLPGVETPGYIQMPLPRHRPRASHHYNIKTISLQSTKSERGYGMASGNDYLFNLRMIHINRRYNMIEHHGVQQQLTELFARKLNLEVASVDTDLVETGLLDSLTLVELLAQLEETFDVSISIDDLEFDNFRSIASIARFLANRETVAEAA